MKLPRRNFLHLAAGAAALPAMSRLGAGLVVAGGKARLRGLRAALPPLHSFTGRRHPDRVARCSRATGLQKFVSTRNPFNHCVCLQQ
jgi:hypothetical protein